MDKIKIRISSFVLLILENDAREFGIVKKDGTVNKNKFLNRLIPNLLIIRKIRREKTKLVLSNMGNDLADVIYEAVNQVIDEVYFDNEDIHQLDYEIWILPTKQAITAFDEIYESELSITALSITEYLRGLLNEYALLPQYKREELAFYNEVETLLTACVSGNILHFEACGNKYKFFAFQYVYGFTGDQTNYIIGFDIKRKQIRSIPVWSIEQLYMLKSKFHTDEYLNLKLQEYVSDCSYGINNIVDLGENYRVGD